MSKFKVGERYVVTKDGYSALKEGAVIEVFKIVDPFIYFEIISGEALDESRAGCFHQESLAAHYLDVFKPTSETITITHDGKTTTARLCDGDTVVYEERSFCDPESVFNFRKGAEKAFKRLAKKMQPAGFDWDGFRAGKFAVHCETEQQAEAFLRACHERGMHWCHRTVLGGSCWKIDKERTCYHYSRGVMHADTEFYASRGIPVVECPFLMPEQPAEKKPEPEKAKFKAGDLARIINSTSKWGEHRFEIGEIVRLEQCPAGYFDWEAHYLDGHDFWFVKEDEIEPYAAPEQSVKETVKLYCVEDYMPGGYATKGKIYEFTPGVGVKYDNGRIGASYDSLSEYFKRNRDFVSYLIPLVKRPAKIGEWVYITHTDYYALAVGDIGKVTETPFHSEGSVMLVPADSNNGLLDGLYFRHDEYLVLDGYREPTAGKEQTYAR